ncbi:UPF0481 protein At3g47200 [Ricinus communis]|uniref:Uncharacterized protein n=1 Tax=Ricinus communis TaxID=3988 RepID=B9RG36_RICCO|nr:UPF0481 protein At3g47200 [Ricinus communis]EEF50157.1 conserved hypothetical protein [Ricinus communis]|eukprot:XP_002512705.1 UPF0481 protein At3g47200 [Ricinus communis]
MAGTNWVIEVNEKLESIDNYVEAERWKQRSIYKVPACVTDLNKKAYRPQAVSFGPYHHGEDHLKPMEEHKHRALLHFLKRSNKPIQLFVDSLSEVVQLLKDSYDPLDSYWQQDTSRFLQLMILDGCFLLEILRIATDQSLDDYAPNDPVFSNHGKLYIMPYIMRDMLMLQNQLPMLVLDKLVAVESGKEKDEEFVNKLILKFCFPDAPVSSLGKCLHPLDVYRKSLLQKQVGREKRRILRSRRQKGGNNIIRSATELNEAGIRFKKSKTRSLKDISFRGGVLRLPVIVVDDATESIFLNLMAFERFHVGAGNEVTSFIFFMDNIIDSERDVALLHSRGIIQNAVGSDKAVAKLFNSLSKDITLDPNSSLDFVHKKVNAYCRKAWNEWRANLIHTYFRNPWAILSLIAAVFLFALTIVQTVYTIYPIYHSSESPSPPMVSVTPSPPIVSAAPSPAAPPLPFPKPPLPQLRH